MTILNIYRTKPKGQYIRFKILISLFLLLISYFHASKALAIVDPLSSPNNKCGVHIISATPDETLPAAQLVNSSGGDWGYITVLVESKDRKEDKWRVFFDDLRKKHLIPIVRLATQPEGNFWKMPYEGEEQAWADFLDNLNWPTKNRYVTIYNEPNQGQEWAGKVDARSYARVLNKTITALKAKNPDFFVLNAGFDASAPEKLPLFQNETTFLREMNEEVPGIFNKLDGWVSHSYPNPGFAGSPNASGKGTVRTWSWELAQLRELGVNKNLPVFITETGWKHAEGIDYDKSLPSAETVGNYLENAFNNAWNDNQIVAVTPFLLSYQEAPFDHFSFKKLTGNPQNQKILGAQYPEYYPHYQTLTSLPKNSGRPVQENKAQLMKGTIYPSLALGESYTISLTFKNTGQSIWNEYDQIEIRGNEDKKGLQIETVKLPTGTKIEPGKEAIFNLPVKTLEPGIFKISLQLFSGSKQFDQGPLNFTTEVKSPVILSVASTLGWKENFAGEYFLTIDSDVLTDIIKIKLNNEGKSNDIEAKYLIPDHSFNFTLQKPFYKTKTITTTVRSGLNTLNFGQLEPDILAAIFRPVELWLILPFSK